MYIQCSKETHPTNSETNLFSHQHYVFGQFLKVSEDVSTARELQHVFQRHNIMAIGKGHSSSSSISKPHSFKQLLSHGTPLRKIIADTATEEIAKALHDLFADKIAAKKIACANARADMHWRARNL